MKGIKIIILGLLIAALFGAGARTRFAARSSSLSGNIADGMYTIVGEASHRCLEIPNNSCASGAALQIFDCDKTEASNNQKFNVVSDGSGNYTVSPVHSDLCLEVSSEKSGDRIPIIQAECASGKVSQKWAMSQFGVNLEIRDVGTNRCLDIMRKGTGNFAPIFLESCNNGPHQRWRLNKTSMDIDQGVICQASASHPAYGCSGTNDQQQQIALGKTLTKARCEEACRVNKMISCRWEGMK